ncbi:MAG: phosphoribosylaminoimidazole carboxylase, partial [Thermoanaerobaculia bacterium]|nr:phosphoribosylaminoimidazole carboxylase [Thermoanaerobaculia bacterium]
MPLGNLFAGLPEELSEERFDELAAAGGVTVERIVSRGHRSPEGFWYDQDRDEWVAVLRGRATLEVEGESEPVELGPG